MPRMSSALSIEDRNLPSYNEEKKDDGSTVAAGGLEESLGKPMAMRPCAWSDLVSPNPNGEGRSLPHFRLSFDGLTVQRLAF